MQKPQLIAVGLLSSGILTAAGPAAADCVFAKLGEMKVDSSAGPMVVDIEIGGVKKKMMINSGSPLSTLKEAGAASLGVKSGGAEARRSVSSRGEVVYDAAHLRNVRIGGAL